MEGDLQAIDPEPWSNIPVPIKESIKVITAHLLSLAADLAHTRSDLKNEIEQTNFRVRKVRKEMQDEMQTVDSIRKHCRDEIQKIEESNSSTVRLAKEILVLVQGNERRKAAEFAGLQAKTVNVEEFLKETQKNLWVAIKKQEADISSKFARLQGDMKTSVQAEISNETSSLRDSISQTQDGWKAACQQLHIEFRQCVLQQEHEINVKKRELEQSIASVKAEMDACASNIDSKISEMSKNLSEAGGEVYEKAKGGIEKVAKITEFHTEEIRSIRADLQGAVAALRREAAALREDAHGNARREAGSVATIRSELIAAQQVMLDQLDAKEKRLLSEIATACETLEVRISSEKDIKMESQFKDIRSKLAVRPT